MIHLKIKQVTVFMNHSLNLEFKKKKMLLSIIKKYECNLEILHLSCCYCHVTCQCQLC